MQDEPEGHFTPEQRELLRDLAGIIARDPGALRWYVDAYRSAGWLLWVIKHGGPAVAVVLIIWHIGADATTSAMGRLRELVR